jgi:hypothetical protein
MIPNDNFINYCVGIDQLSNITITKNSCDTSIHQTNKQIIGLPTTIDNLNKDITISHFRMAIGNTNIRCDITLHLQTYDLPPQRQINDLCICDLGVTYDIGAPILTVISDIYKSVYDRICRSVVADFGRLLTSNEIDEVSFYCAHLFLYYMTQLNKIGTGGIHERI